MNRSVIAYGLLLGSLLGCAPPAEEVYDDEDRDPPIYTFVLSTMDDSDPSVGFDLDGVVSEGTTEACADQRDHSSRYGVGIDNASAAAHEVVLEPVHLAQTIEPRIAAGEHLLLMELRDLDSTEEDPRVGVRLYLGSAAGPIALEDGRIAPGQTFQQLGADIANVEDGRVVDADLMFEVPLLPLGLPPSASGERVQLHDVRVRAQIDLSAYRVTGEIGGSVPATEIAAYTGMDLDEVRSLLDLEPDPTDDRLCNAGSAGLSFEMVSSVPE